MNTENTEPKLIFFKTLDKEFEFYNALGQANYRFIDIGELLAIRELINEDDAETGVEAYLKFAKICEDTANTCLEKKHIQSARDAYFRASRYYFGATGYLDESPHPERFVDLWKSHRRCWGKAAKLMELEYEEFEIPYEGTTLQGFFFKRKNDNKTRPLFIMNNGSDGSILDAWSWGGSAAFDRGYNVLTFDGPGQGSSLFLKNIYFRHDWENVITPVIESIINRTDIDKNRIVLYGISQGGYWVPRAAAFENRIKVAVADPGVVDVSLAVMKFLPEEMIALLDAGEKDEFNKYMGMVKGTPAEEANYNFRSRPYGINNAYDFFANIRKYNLTQVAEKIKCHTIITDPDNEQFWPGQSRKLFDMINAPKELIRFSASEGGNYHCEPKAKMLWEQRLFDKIDEIIFG